MANSFFADLARKRHYVRLPAAIITDAARVGDHGYAETLSEKLAYDCLKVLSSSWYQDIFPMAGIARKRARRHDDC